MIELLTALVPIIVALIPVLATTISTGRKTREAVTTVSNKLDAHIKESDWANAKQIRVRILRFYDEVCDGKKHSENLWEDVLDDIDSYESFCQSHPDFHNSKGKLAMEFLKDTFAKLKKEGKL